MEKVNMDYDKKELEKSYNELLRDEEFKNFLNKINLPSSTLMKYASLLQSSFLEYKNCLKCKNLFECKNKICGYAYLPRIVNEGLVFTYKPCKYKEKLDKLIPRTKRISPKRDPNTF